MLRRHAAVIHLLHYRKWCTSNNFESMLPQDTKEHKKAAIDKERGDRQLSVTEHFGPEDLDTKSIPYSDKALETAVLEWLIETNQPIQVFGNAAFKKLLDIASRAT
ncbi:hypothetical protein DFH94DRAFT_695826 [Russula ochroleuca]|uniref:Uncharacterized protein n=1 Tax=Russula ochroleuca TaxID=152965 RepID=A0A9P5K093_9AGAM|nr:hypothetical protein DFH94DRAFT_695826 [Russula ochroleuca]